MNICRLLRDKSYILNDGEQATIADRIDELCCDRAALVEDLGRGHLHQQQQESEIKQLRKVVAIVLEDLEVVGSVNWPRVIETLRLAAGIPVPPADETNDPDPDGDRQPENDR